MSADHRKPVVAFVVLALLAAALVGFQRADAYSARFFASVLAATGHVESSFPDARESALLTHAGPRGDFGPPTSATTRGSEAVDPAAAAVDLAGEPVTAVRHDREHGGHVAVGRSRGQGRPDRPRRASDMANEVERGARGLSDGAAGKAAEQLRVEAERELRAAARAGHRSLQRTGGGHHRGRSHERRARRAGPLGDIGEFAAGTARDTVDTAEKVVRQVGDLSILD